MKHPMQPIYRDETGVTRFKKNHIVRYLLDHGWIDLNKIAVMSFADEDREQFAQLIGYSVSGFGELSYASPESIATADLMAVKTDIDEKDARIAVLESKLAHIKNAARGLAVAAFDIHPNDLVI